MGSCSPDHRQLFWWALEPQFDNGLMKANTVDSQLTLLLNNPCLFVPCVLALSVSCVLDQYLLQHIFIFIFCITGHPFVFFLDFCSFRVPIIFLLFCSQLSQSLNKGLDNFPSHRKGARRGADWRSLLLTLHNIISSLNCHYYYYGLIKTIVVIMLEVLAQGGCRTSLNLCLFMDTCFPWPQIC